MSTLPPSESFCQSLSTSSFVAQRTANEIAGVNWNRGPALIAANG
jgi:hypothetical protein